MGQGVHEDFQACVQSLASSYLHLVRGMGHQGQVTRLVLWGLDSPFRIASARKRVGLVLRRITAAVLPQSSGDSFLVGLWLLVLA